MVALLLLTLLQSAQPPAKPATPPPTAAPAKQAPRPRAASTATTTALLFITNTSGSPIEGVTVNVMGPVDREVKSPGSGPTRIPGLRAGTYRVRFTHEDFITFEKEIAWRAGTAAPEVAITLNPAPEAPAPAATAPPPSTTKPEPAAPKLPPPGTPKTMSLIDFIENNLISGREPQKQSVLGCSGAGQALLWQIRDPWTGRQHEVADGMIYVVAGEGSFRLGDRDVNVTNGSFAVVPRGTTYGFNRKGRNPLIVLAVLSGAPCVAD
jgi:hypothetical protein